MGVILETNQLCKFYGTGENQVNAVNHVNIQIQQGEFVAIVGKSGSGKSTLLHMLGGLDTPTSGSVILSDKDLYSMKEDQLAVFRRRKRLFRHLCGLKMPFSPITTPLQADWTFG